MEPKISLLTTLEEYIEVEELRREVLDLHNLNTYRYIKDLKENELYSYATRIDNTIVAGCYFSVYYSILNINQLFVKETYQNTGARLGRNILQYLFKNKEEIELLTGKKISLSMIYPTNDKSLALYKKIGYENINNDYSMMLKKI